MYGLLQNSHIYTVIPRNTKAQDVFIAHPNSVDQMNPLFKFLRSLNIQFELSESAAYNSEFVNMALESRQKAQNGEVIRVKKDELLALPGL